MTVLVPQTPPDSSPATPQQSPQQSRKPSPARKNWRAVAPKAEQWQQAKASKSRSSSCGKQHKAKTMSWGGSQMCPVTQTRRASGSWRKDGKLDVAASPPVRNRSVSPSRSSIDWRAGCLAQEMRSHSARNTPANSPVNTPSPKHRKLSTSKPGEFRGQISVTSPDQKVRVLTKKPAVTSKKPAEPVVEPLSTKKPTFVKRTSLTKLNPNACEFSPTLKQERNPLGGKLVHFAGRLFGEAYGLNGAARRPHADIIAEAQKLTGCSVRAIHEVLYGRTYDSQLHELRAKIPGYPPKYPNRLRSEYLNKLVANLEAHAFYHYDGNSAQSGSLPAPADLLAPAAEDVAMLSSAADRHPSINTTQMLESLPPLPPPTPIAATSPICDQYSTGLLAAAAVTTVAIIPTLLNVFM